MKDINTLRHQINTLDNEIMALLNQRFNIVESIGDLKHSKKVAIEDNSRETLILDKASSFTYKTEIEAIYKTIFTVSKNLQRK